MLEFDVEPYFLATLLTWPDEIAEVALVVKPGDFTMEKHEAIYGGILQLVAKGTVVDLRTLEGHLLSSGEIGRAGGKAYLLDIANICASSGVTAMDHARIIREASVRKTMRQDLLTALEALKDPAVPVMEVAGMAEKAAMVAAGEVQGEGLRPASSYLPEVFAVMEKQAKGEITGLKTGFYDIDAHTSGFQKSDLIILGGRPRMGKTALATDIAGNVAIEQGKSVAFFEMEMAGRQIIERSLFSRAQVNAQLLRSGKLPKRDYPRLALAVPPIDKSKWFVDGTTGVTPLQMMSKCRRHMMKHGLDLVVVDNIQKMRGDGKYQGNKRLEIADITNSLKNMAKELDVPILAISHLSRGPDHRADPEPVLSDLQESGNIEQDADIVMFIYREEVYKDVEDDKRGEAKIIFSKYRNGQEGYKTLRFNEEFASFSNWSGRQDEPPPSYKEKQSGDNFMDGIDGN